MTGLLDAGVAVYVAMAVALSVWIGIFIYLWRIDAQARALRDELRREQQRAPEPAAPRATVTRVRPAQGEPVEK
jgi:CcmD family protein